MLEQWARQLTSRFGQAGIIAEEETETYNYCFEILLSNLAYYGTVVVLTMITKQVAFAVCYTLSFLLIRHTTGGYHASSHLRCYVLSVSVYVMTLALWCVIPWSKGLMVASSWLAMVILWRLGPVEHENKPMSPEERSSYQKKGRFCSFLLVAAVTMLCTIGQVDLAAAVFLGLISAALSGIAGQVANKERRRADEEVIV